MAQFKRATEAVDALPALIDAVASGVTDSFALKKSLDETAADIAALRRRASETDPDRKVPWFHSCLILFYFQVVKYLSPLRFTLHSTPSASKTARDFQRAVAVIHIYNIVCSVICATYKNTTYSA